MNTERLGIYLNDHLAGSVSALELVGHLMKAESCKELRGFLKRLHEEIGKDQQTLQDLMKNLGIAESKLKQAVSWAAEKMGRLKLHPTHGNDPDLLLSLEGLGLGIMGKKALWESLEALNGAKGVPNFDFIELQKRAQEQYDSVKEQRIEMAKKILGG